MGVERTCVAMGCEVYCYCRDRFLIIMKFVRDLCLCRNQTKLKVVPVMTHCLVCNAFWCVFFTLSML